MNKLSMDEYVKLSSGATPGIIALLFGEGDLQTSTVAKILNGKKNLVWYYVDTRSSDGGQILLRSGVRVSPHVVVYKDGFVIWEKDGCDIVDADTFGMGV